MNKFFSCVFILATIFSCKKKEQNAVPVVLPIPNSVASNTLDINEIEKISYDNVVGHDAKMISAKDGSIYILADQYDDSLRSQVVLIKTTIGTEIWRRTFGELGDDEIGGLICSNDGGVIVGSSWMPKPSFNSSLQSIRLTKYTAEGNLVFDKKYKFQNDTELQDIVETTTNNIIAISQYTDDNSNILFATLISKFSAEGDSLQSIVFKDYKISPPTKSEIIKHSNGYLYFNTKSRKMISDNYGDDVTAIIKIDESLNFNNEILIDSIGSANETTINSIKLDSSELIALGTKDYKRMEFGSYYHGFDVPTILKINSSDKIGFRKEYKKYDDDIAREIVITKEGYLLFVNGARKFNTSYGPGTAQYPYFLSMDKNGENIKTKDFLSYYNAPLDLIININGEYFMVNSKNTHPTSIEITKFK